MEKKDLSKLSNEELLIEEKKLKKSKFFSAMSIGFLFGILIFGVVSWSLLPSKHLAFLIPMFIPVVFIYKLLTSPNKNKELEDILKERKLNK